MIKIVDGVNSYSLLREKKIFIKKFSNTRHSLHDNSHIITLPSSTNSLVSLITFHPVNQRLSSRYFIRFDRLILPGRACRYTLHISTVTSCIELWFPTSASVASPPFFFFSLSFSLARLISPPSRILLVLFFFYFYFFFFYIYIAALLCGKDDRISLRRACCAIEADARCRLRSRSIIFKHFFQRQREIHDGFLPVVAFALGRKNSNRF